MLEMMSGIFWRLDTPSSLVQIYVCPHEAHSTVRSLPCPTVPPPPCLYQEILRQIGEQFPKTANERYEGLVFFIGNGLTRIAAALSATPQMSWSEWTERCRSHLLEAAGPDPVPSIHYLRSRGFTNDQVFSILAHHPKAQPHVFLRELYTRVKDIPPSPLHKLILQASRAVITTNYDNLFEESSVVGWGRVDPLGDDGWKPGDTTKLIYKVHGTFPRLPDDSYPARTQIPTVLRSITRNT